MLVLDLEPRKYSNKGGPLNRRGDVVEEEGLTASEFAEYSQTRTGTVGSAEQFIAFQFASHMRCVHCRYGAVSRSEKDRTRQPSRSLVLMGTEQ